MAPLSLQYANNGWFGSDVNRDLTARSVMVARIRCDAGGEQNHIDLSIGGVTKRFGQYATSSGTNAVVTATYQDVRIPMVENGINRAAPGQLSLSFWHGGTGSLWIEEIRFE